MIRIRTTFGKHKQARVLTIFHGGVWITLTGKGKTIDAHSLLEAGQNHLAAAVELSKLYNNDT